MKFKSHYSEKTHKGLVFLDPSLTQQSMAADADINNIMKKYIKTGVLPNMIKADPQYGDFSSVPDLIEAHQIIAKAEEQFMALPSGVRKEFDNDPGNFLEFVHDPRNSDRLVKMGLTEPQKPAQKPLASEGQASQGEAKKEPAKAGSGS